MSFAQSIVEDLLVKSGRHCCLCRRFVGSKIEIHHIKPKCDGGTDSEDNAIPLCYDCHADVHANMQAHPRGRKYSPKELRRHRDSWFQYRATISMDALIRLVDSYSRTPSVEKSSLRAASHPPKKASDDEMHQAGCFMGNLLANYLNLSESDHCLVVTDGFGQELAPVFARAATYANTRVRFFECDKSTVRRANQGKLPAELARAVQSAAVMITSLSDDSETVKFRVTLLQIAIRAGVRVLHMPGVSLALIGKLKMVEPEYIFLRYLLVDRVLRATPDDIRIETVAPAGKSLCLNIGVDDKYIHHSTGVPGQSQIENLPFGQVYAPVSVGVGEGAVAIDFGVGDVPLPARACAVFEFASGRLSRVSGNRTAIQFMGRLKSAMTERGDRGWDRLAEFSVGINAGVPPTMDPPFLGSKAEGIVGLALGCNTPFGGSIHSDAYTGLLIRKSNVRVGGTLLVTEGKLNYDLLNLVRLLQ